jgi:NAD+ kinase
VTVPARRVLLVTHPSREVARHAVQAATRRFHEAGVELVVPLEDVLWLEAEVPDAVLLTDVHEAKGCDVAIVLGGDGTMLRAAELTHRAGVPVVGINLGHVGFLAEFEERDLTAVVDQVIEGRWTVEERLALDITVSRDGEALHRLWAVNEASLEKADRQRMLEVVVEIDGRPLSRWGCDGVVCATPTGSTAYAFSAGGPVVWPEVEALLCVPISAHALFARPLVTAPDSVIAVELVGRVDGVLWSDGRRSVPVQVGDRVDVRRSVDPLRVARLERTPFTDRLVAKFALPIDGWRGRREPRR